MKYLVKWPSRQIKLQRIAWNKQSSAKDLQPVEDDLKVVRDQKCCAAASLPQWAFEEASPAGNAAAHAMEQMEQSSGTHSQWQMPKMMAKGRTAMGGASARTQVSDGAGGIMGKVAWHRACIAPCHGGLQYLNKRRPCCLASIALPSYGQFEECSLQLWVTTCHLQCQRSLRRR